MNCCFKASRSISLNKDGNYFLGLNKINFCPWCGKKLKNFSDFTHFKLVVNYLWKERLNIDELAADSFSFITPKFRSIINNELANKSKIDGNFSSKYNLEKSLRAQLFGK